VQNTPKLPLSVAKFGLSWFHLIYLHKLGCVQPIFFQKSGEAGSNQIFFTNLGSAGSTRFFSQNWVEPAQTKF